MDRCKIHSWPPVLETTEFDFEHSILKSTLGFYFSQYRKSGEGSLRLARPFRGILGVFPPSHLAFSTPCPPHLLHPAVFELYPVKTNWSSSKQIVTLSSLRCCCKLIEPEEGVTGTSGL